MTSRATLLKRLVGNDSHRLRRVVDRKHRHRHRRRRRQTARVGDRVGEAVRPVPVQLGRIAHPAVRYRGGPVARRADRHHLQRVAVDVGIVGQHVDHHRHVLERLRLVVDCLRRVVHRRHRHFHRRRRRQAAGVGHRVGEAVLPVPVQLRRVAHPPAHHRRRPVLGRRNRRYPQLVAVRVRVVRQHVDHLRRVLRRLGTVVGRLGRLRTIDHPDHHIRLRLGLGVLRRHLQLELRRA